MLLSMPTQQTPWNRISLLKVASLTDTSKLSVSMFLWILTADLILRYRIGMSSPPHLRSFISYIPSFSHFKDHGSSISFICSSNAFNIDCIERISVQADYI